MKKVLVIFHDNNLYSGATMSFLTVVKKIAKNNDVYAVIPYKNGDLNKQLEEMGIKFFRMHYGGNVYSYNKNLLVQLMEYLRCMLKSLFSLCEARIFCNTVTKLNIDVVYSNTSTIYFGAWICKFLNLKHIWHFREFGREDQNSIRIWKKWFVHMAKDAQLIITISHALQEYVKKHFDIDSILLYDDLECEYKNVEKTPHMDNNILITGRISEGKGQLLLLKAIMQLNRQDVHVYIAGARNEYAKFLQKYVEDNDIKNIEFCGLVKNMNLLRKKIDISVVCSKKEAFGRIVIEDMLAGNIVIGCDAGAIPELIEDGVNGFIFEADNSNALMDVIQKVLNIRDKSTYIENARRFAEKFISDNTSCKICSLIEEM